MANLTDGITTGELAGITSSGANFIFTLKILAAFAAALTVAAWVGGML